MILYAVVLSVVALILAIIPVVGTLIGLGLMSFLGTVTSFTILAETYAE
jgi:predicted PurR-regulated permease PerM